MYVCVCVGVGSFAQRPVLFPASQHLNETASDKPFEPLAGGLTDTDHTATKVPSYRSENECILAMSRMPFQLV